MLLFQSDAEILFPSRVIPRLRNLRGPAFNALIDRVLSCPSQGDVELLGFVLMMIRLDSCLSCTADSYRAMNGCTACAIKTLRAFRGTDEDLLQRWEAACQEVRQWQAKFTLA
jgi:hypothetical protein